MTQPKQPLPVQEGKQLTPEHEQWLRQSFTLLTLKKLENKRDYLLDIAMRKTRDAGTEDFELRLLLNEANTVNQTICMMRGSI